MNFVSNSPESRKFISPISAANENGYIKHHPSIHPLEKNDRNSGKYYYARPSKQRARPISKFLNFCTRLPYFKNF